MLMPLIDADTPLEVISHAMLILAIRCYYMPCFAGRGRGGAGSVTFMLMRICPAPPLRHLLRSAHDVDISHFAFSAMPRHERYHATLFYFHFSRFFDYFTLFTRFADFSRRCCHVAMPLRRRDDICRLRHVTLDFPLISPPMLLAIITLRHVILCADYGCCTTEMLSCHFITPLFSLLRFVAAMLGYRFRADAMSFDVTPRHACHATRCLHCFTAFTLMPCHVDERCHAA